MWIFRVRVRKQYRTERTLVSVLTSNRTSWCALTGYKLKCPQDWLSLTAKIMDKLPHGEVRDRYGHCLRNLLIGIPWPRNVNLYPWWSIKPGNRLQYQLCCQTLSRSSFLIKGYRERRMEDKLCQLFLQFRVWVGLTTQYRKPKLRSSKGASELINNTTTNPATHYLMEGALPVQTECCTETSQHPTQI